MNKVIIGLVAAVVLAAVGGGAFWAGTKVGENRIIQDPSRLFQQGAMDHVGQFPGSSERPQPGEGGTTRGGGGMMGASGGTMGTIEAIEDDTLLVSTAQETIRVQMTGTTLIEKFMSVDAEDLEIGEQVVVSGSRADDGTMTARSIRSVRGLQFSMPDQQ